jgi:hypothetical protein
MRVSSVTCSANRRDSAASDLPVWWMVIMGIAFAFHGVVKHQECTNNQF